MARRKKRQDSPVKTVILILAAIVVMSAAIFVVVGIVEKIQSDYEKIEIATKEESTAEAIEIEKEERLGWNQTEDGWIYLLDEETRASDQWMEIEGFLYSFDGDGIMRTGEWSSEGQIYTLHETKGYLQEIRTDLNYVPEDTGEDLDSLVRTNAFWCYLDGEDTGVFKTILYRKTVENKVLPLGDADAPEKTTRYSMRTYGDYVYYLPKVSESSRAGLSDSEKALCDVLTRMIPGQKTKEIIADNVDGYLVLDDVIYYSQGGEIYSAKSGRSVAVREAQYQIELSDGALYLRDMLGNPAASDSGIVEMEDRRYKVGDDGKILDIEKGEEEKEGKLYYLRGNGTESAVYQKDGKSEKKIIQEVYGVQSFCIVDNMIYYSAYVDKGSDGAWYSRIYRTDLAGSGRWEVSGLFLGAMGNMYYFPGEGGIYGEYHPSIGKKAYGCIASIGTDGTIRRIRDEGVRTGYSVSGNDILKLAMVLDGEIYCLWQDCDWTPSAGITAIKWSRGVKLNGADAGSVETIEKLPEQTDGEAQGQGENETGGSVIIDPIGGNAGSPVSPLETSEDGQSADQEVVIGTDGPTAQTESTKPVQTAPSAEITPSTEAVTIIPLE